ncbi:zinc finger domain-containing protein [Metarhizium robertsii ARSEF 23]|uniref:RING-type E3 ubiquitin transferase n=1 Tax=Metarhizium robertsii (strain ARSEF 23 / ATCC MYA-3075) TaxID=655844 RepID=E9F0F2_METRA|nr:zinc finger domain-containing protein [Metarhizium robertsii ARSEF 23]EFY98612.2 zinc finger domain-containing protein [Metarhizium robertsii ARSEF 23]
MSSPRGGSSPVHDDHHPRRPESTSTTSYATGGPQHCRWKTAEFHDQECSRYFDCPSHVVERELSDSDHVEQSQRADSPEAGPSAGIQISDTEDAPRRPSTDDESNTQPESGHSHVQTQTALESEASASHRQSAIQSASLSTAQSADEHQNEPPVVLPIRSSSIPIPPPSQSRESAVREEAARAQVHNMPDPRVNWADLESRYRGAYLQTAHEGEHQAMESLPRTMIRPRDVHHPPAPSRRRESEGRRASQDHRVNRPRGDGSVTPEFVLPRWQPDAEVTYCPICHTQFSFFVRKHHCRKCGRVVCATCSPHRIIIPHQYIVRQPGSDISMPPSLLVDAMGAGYLDVNGLSGGERVRLCNPCVPDPNTAPPESPTPSIGSPRSPHQRSRSSFGPSHGAGHPSNRYGTVFTGGDSRDPLQYHYARARSITMSSPNLAPSSHRMSAPHVHPSNLERFLTAGPSSIYPSSSRHRHSSYGYGEISSSSSRQRALPHPPQIAEEDECPVCHRELPLRLLPDSEALREAHINKCIRDHSTYGSLRPPEGQESSAPPMLSRRTGMYIYPATEKDCVDDAECTICLEEFTVGIPMARLECLCRFHKSCISAWFVNHPGRCPVHQHDGFGF